MKKTLIISALLAFVPLAIFAQEDAASATVALDFVRFGADPRADAMGGASLASVSSPAWSFRSNPAAIPYSAGKWDLGLSYLLWQPSSTHYLNLGGAFKASDRVGLCFGVATGIDGPVGGVSDSGASSGEFSPLDFQGSLGVGVRLCTWVSLGANARFAFQNLDGYTLSSFMCDAFVLGCIDDFSAALGVQNLGTKARYGRKSGIDSIYPIPTAAALGLCYAPPFALSHGLDLRADLRCGFCGTGFSASFGAGYTYNDMLSLRAGFNYGGPAMASYGTIGLGFAFGGFRLDAAYFLASRTSPAANTFTLGLGVGF